MGSIVHYFGVVIIIIGTFMIFSSFYNDAYTSSGFTNVSVPTSFNKTAQYGSYLNNQTSAMKNTIVNSQSDNSAIGVIGGVITLITQGSVLALTGLFSILEIGFALLNDFGAILIIPVGLIGLAFTYLVFKFGAQIIRAVRLGDI